MLGYQHEYSWPQLLVKSLYVQHSNLLGVVLWKHTRQIRQVALSSGDFMLLTGQSPLPQDRS